MLFPSRRLTALGLFVLMIGILGVSPVSAQGPESAPWTTAGSAGTVDEADLANINLGSPVAGAVAIRSAGTVHIRYNVVAVAGVLGGTGLTMTARYQNGAPLLENSTTFFWFNAAAPGQIVVRLMQYNLMTGVLTNLLTLDSNNFPSANGFQVQSVATSACARPFTVLDFVNNSYFMDVAITKPAAGPLGDISFFSARPALAMIKLVNNAPCIL